MVGQWRMALFLFVGLLPIVGSQLQGGHSCRLPKLPEWSGRHRNLDDEFNGTDTCSICAPYALSPDQVPLYEPNEMIEPGVTCGEFEAWTLTLPADSEDCSMMKWLFPQCCESPPTFECETDIRVALFEEKRYDPAVPPIPNGYKKPLVVEVSAQYQTIEEIDVQSGTANILMTVTLIWNDPRLAWQVGPDKCTDLISVRASNDVEKVEIWSPDFDLYNQVQGMQQFAEANAEVFPDGTVVWSRTGSLVVICRFQGLAQIPFDTLGCQLLMGPRQRIGYGQIDYQLEGGDGLTVGTFGSSYNEYSFVPEMAHSGRTSANMTIFFNLYFKRAKQHYVFNIVIPTIILTYVSFGTFLLDLRMGERLSYGMALALVVVAQQIVTGDLIPVSDERLWIDKFVGWSFYWVIFGLVESVSLGYLFFLRQDSEVIQDGDPETTERNAALGLVSQRRLDPVHESQESNGGDDRDAERPPDSRQGHPYAFGVTKENLREKLSVLKQADAKSDDAKSVSRPFFTIPLRKIDHFCFMFTTVSYTAYIIAMFTSVDRWGSRVDGGFYTETDTVLDDDLYSP